MIDIVVTIDDTDNLETRGTGHLADMFRLKIAETFGGTVSLITRHQLFVSDEVPYTSHNSAMCFRASVPEDSVKKIIALGADFLVKERAEGSDPGLCVAIEKDLSPEARRELISFGNAATCSVLNKEMAYDLARRAGVHLSEHGGTGDGIIGALAGTGLRLGGNNGRFKGWHPIPPELRKTTVRDFCETYPIDRVQTEAGEVLAPDEVLHLEERVKTVLLDSLNVLPVRRVEGEWHNLPKIDIKKY